MCRQTIPTLLLLLAMATLVHADDTQQPADTAASPPVAAHSERIARLIRQLDSPRFAERQAATSELAHVGVEAIAALERVAENGSYEASTRAVQVLDTYRQQGTMQIQEQAETALEEIASNETHRVVPQVRHSLVEASQVPLPPAATVGFDQSGILECDLAIPFPQTAYPTSVPQW